MPTEPNRPEPVDRGGAQGPMPALVPHGQYWVNPATGQWYDSNLNPIPDPTTPPDLTGIRTPPSDLIRPPPRQLPGDPPVPISTARDRAAPPVGGSIDSEGNGTLPGQTPAAGQPPTPQTDYLPVPPAWSGSGPYQLANPMPTMPTMGTAPMQAYQAWALQQGRSGGAGQPFTPWGSPMGQVSQILRYGGSPGATMQGGFGGSVGTPSGQGAPINVPGVPGWTNPATPPPGVRPPSAAPVMPGPSARDRAAPPTSGVVSSDGTGSGPSDETRAQRIWRLAGERNEPRQDSTGLTVTQLRLLLATQGKILRGL